MLDALVSTTEYRVRAIAPVSLGFMLVVAIGIADGIWNLHAGLSFVGWTRSVCAFVGLLLVSLFYQRIRSAPPIAEMAFYAGTWVAFAVLGCIFTYLAATMDYPLLDVDFARADAALGFHWLAWVKLVALHPYWRTGLFIAYSSLLLQIAGSIVLFALARVSGRNEELLFNVAATLIATALLSGLFPALPPSVLSGLNTGSDADTAYVAHLLILRQGGTPEFVLAGLQGIVTFPSYHATLAVLFSYAHRGIRWTALPIAALNLLMLISTTSEGGHYLVDVFAGTAVAIVVICMQRLLLRYRMESTNLALLAYQGTPD